MIAQVSYGHASIMPKYGMGNCVCCTESTLPIQILADESMTPRVMIDLANKTCEFVRKYLDEVK